MPCEGREESNVLTGSLCAPTGYLKEEKQRQVRGLELIASENFCSLAGE